MPSQFRVEKIVGNEEWKGQYGPMVQWDMICRDLSTDRSGPVSVNAKPGNPYAVGQSFWAESQGEKNGRVKLKRVQPPPGATIARDYVAMTQEGQTKSSPPNHPRPYEKAVQVYKQMASDFDRESGYPPEYATTLFIAWMQGKIADPDVAGGRPELPRDDDEPQWGDQ